MTGELHIADGQFAAMREEFSVGMRDALRRMLKNSVDEGKVTLVLALQLEEDKIVDIDGRERIVKTPCFKYRIKTSVAQGIQCDGSVKLFGTEDVMDGGGNLMLRKYGGQMSLFEEEDE